MVALIILGIIIALIAILMSISVGVLAIYREGDFYFAITVASFSIPLSKFLDGDKKRGTSKRKKVSKREDAKKIQKKETKKNFPPIGKLIAILFDILGKLRKSITIHRLEIKYLISGDPFAVAMQCGAINETLGIVTPLALKLFKIKRSSVAVMPNFASEESIFELTARISIHIGSVVRIALSALVQFIKARKENNNGKTSSGRPDGSNDEKNPRDGRREYHRGHSHSDA